MTQMTLVRPIRPGHLAVRRVAGDWTVLSTTALPGWGTIEPGLYRNRMLFPRERTLENTLQLARKWSSSHRARLAAEANLAEACS